MRIAVALLGLMFVLPSFGAQCVGRSADRMAALVELYTSEGCSSCPPADRWLSRLAETYAPQQVVPIALHVDYWDYVGWKDPYAQHAFSQRQRKLSQLQRLALVYTPQVLLQGAEFRGWSSSEFDAAVARINARPSRARLQLQIVSLSGGGARVRAEAALIEPGTADRARLYVAAYRNRLESRVTAGENRGRLLAHDHVVLEWRGPYAFDREARVVQELELLLVPGAKPADSGVVAFVQDRRSAEVLQVLALAGCGS